MKYTLSLILVVILFSTKSAKGQPINLSNVTFGFGAGVGYSFFDQKEYSLSTDTLHALKVGSVSKAKGVISSIITVRLSKVASKSGSSRLYSQNALLENANRKAQLSHPATDTSSKMLSGKQIRKRARTESGEAKWWEKLTFNLAINLADVNTEGLSFNKPIDGGFGIGYCLGSNMQIAAFFDAMRVRQMRDYIVKDYENKPIPKGKDVYTALDINDNDLFTIKTAAGVSLKFIYSIPAKGTQ